MPALQDLSMVGAAMGILTVVGHATDCVVNLAGLAVLVFSRGKVIGARLGCGGSAATRVVLFFFACVRCSWSVCFCQVYTVVVVVFARWWCGTVVVSF